MRFNTENLAKLGWTVGHSGPIIEIFPERLHRLESLDHLHDELRELRIPEASIAAMLDDIVDQAHSLQFLQAAKESMNMPNEDARPAGFKGKKA